MKWKISCAAALLAAVVTGCGGGGDSAFPEQPEFSTSEDPAHKKALPLFVQAIDSATIAQMPNRQGCDPDVGCPGATAGDSDPVVGKDLAMAITDPSTDVPGGAAFFELPNPQGLVPDVAEPQILGNPFGVPDEADTPVEASGERVRPQFVSETPKLIANPAQSTKRTQRVKLRVHFKSIPGHHLPCSGTLIAPEWLVTAGHCVFLPKSGQKKEYPKSVEVIPGYGNANPDFGLQPMGVARVFVKRVLTRKAYWEKSDPNFDVAWMQITHDVGGFLGFHAVKNLTCDEALARTFTTSAYPAAANDPYPSSFGLPVPNGDRMVETKFNFNKCNTGDQNNIYKVTGFEAKGGESGAAAVLPASGGFGGVAAGVLSEGTEFVHGSQAYTNFTRFSTNTRDKIVSSLQSTTPTEPDLVTTFVRLTTENVVPGKLPTFSGGQTVNLVAWMYNKGKKTFSGNLAWNIYFSKNDYITTNDQKIGPTQKVPGFELKGSNSAVFAPKINMPTCRPKGTSSADVFYVGVIINNADVDTANNDSGSFSSAFRLNAPECVK